MTWENAAICGECHPRMPWACEMRMGHSGGHRMWSDAQQDWLDWAGEDMTVEPGGSRWDPRYSRPPTGRRPESRPAPKPEPSRYHLSVGHADSAGYLAYDMCLRCGTPILHDNRADTPNAREIHDRWHEEMAP